MIQHGWKHYEGWREDNEKGFNVWDLWKVGVPRFREDLVNHEYSDLKIGRWWDIIMWVIYPHVFVILLLWFWSEMILDDPDDWWKPWNLEAWANLVLQWALVMGGLIYLNDRMTSYPLRPKLEEEDIWTEEDEDVAAAEYVDEDHMEPPEAELSDRPPPRS